MTMGTLRDLNPNPELTKYLVEKEAFDGGPFVLVDVGSKNGFESHWDHFGSQIKKVGFEPNEASYQDCVERWAEKNEIYFPIALGSDLEKRRLLVTRYPAASSFLTPNVDELARFAHSQMFEVVGDELVDTTSLDRFCQEHGLAQVDFIKLDAEGFELDILYGAEDTLRKSILGLSIEVGFLTLRENQPLFSDIDVFLRSLGFVMFDLDLNRYPRHALGHKLPGSGQVLVGQALYLRDAIGDCKRGEFDTEFWTRLNILKMASIFEIFDLPDCAMELISGEIPSRYFEEQEFARLEACLRRSGLRGKNRQTMRSVSLRFRNFARKVLSFLREL